MNDHVLVFEIIYYIFVTITRNLNARCIAVSVALAMVRIDSDYIGYRIDRFANDKKSFLVI